MSVTGNKAELARALRCSLPTLSAWMMRYRPEFPIAETGSNGRSYVFDFDAVFDFLRTKQEEQTKAGAERDEQLAQLRLPFDVPGVEATPARPTIKDEIAAMTLRRLQREEAEKSGKLVPAEEMGAAMSAVLGRLSRDSKAFIGQVAREQNWPISYARSIEARFGDVQRAAVKDLSAQFAGESADDARNYG